MNLEQSEQLPAYKLELKAAPGLSEGKVGDRFVVANLGALQPVTVTLIAQNKKDDGIKMVLGKDDWSEKLREARTSAEGQVSIHTRTQGDLRITVLADGEPKPYWLPFGRG